MCKTYFNSELVIKLLSRDIINVASQNGRREHVVFSLTVARRVSQTSEAPPTFVAQTKKNNEKQILKKVH